MLLTRHELSATLVVKIGNDAISRGVGESESGKEGGVDALRFVFSEPVGSLTDGLYAGLSTESFLRSPGDGGGKGGFLDPPCMGIAKPCRA